MSLRILFVGDVFGSPGRRAVTELLDGIVRGLDVDLVVANAENAAGGFGITRDIVRELFAAGCDVLTGGNHTWDKKEALDLLDDDERVLRPHNYAPGNPGSGMAVVQVEGSTVAVINVQGRVFMPPTDCPFAAVDRLLESVRGEADVVVVDMHAEATSEKMAMAWHLDGRAACLVGTHTHVQTADEQIFPDGLGYITDLGMTGPHRSVIGVRVEDSLGRFLDGRPRRFRPATEDIRLHGALVTVDPTSGRATAIRRIVRRLD